MRRGTQYLIFQLNLTWLKNEKKIDDYFQVMIALDISYKVKLNALSIKIISRNLTLLVLQISAVFEVRHELWVN